MSLGFNPHLQELVVRDMQTFTMSTWVEIDLASMSTIIEMGEDTVDEQKLVAEVREAQPADLPSDTTFFRDGVRRIDFIIAYNEDLHDAEAHIKKEKRLEYQSYLINMGLQLEMEPSEGSVSGQTTFIKVHAPWEPLSTYAEILHIHVPLKESDVAEVSRLDYGPLSCLGEIFKLKSEAVPTQADYFMTPFKRSQQDVYSITDHDILIPPAVRSEIVHHMLHHCPMSNNSKNIFSLKKMINIGYYSDAYPLHDGELEHPPTNTSQPSVRNTLWSEWARPGRFFKEQPLDLVHAYFGEQVGLYFAWLGFYTKMLGIAAFVGLLCFFCGMNINLHTVTNEQLCNSTISGNIIMCPQCDQKCTYWRLNDTCKTAKQSAYYENPFTILFSIFMGLWATVFLEMWKRYHASLGLHWHLKTKESDPIRPEYEARCTKKKINIVTMEEEPDMSRSNMMHHYCYSVGVALFSISLIFLSLVSVITYRLSIFALLSANFPKYLSEIKVIGILMTPDTLTSITAAFVYVFIIRLLSKFYNKLAILLTKLEMPRTQTQFEYRLTLKTFLFKFINYYSSCFYIAFLKQKFSGHPGHYRYFGNWRIEDCAPSGCLFELTTQLTSVMVINQIIDILKEVIIPWFTTWVKRQAKKRPGVYTRWEQDMNLQPQSSLGLFDEYHKMVIQFVFVTLFAACFPLAPLLVLLNNIIKVRVDAGKFVTKMRRPVVSRDRRIGAWADIVRVMATISVITNAFLVTFTSDIIPRLVYYYGYSVQQGTDLLSMDGYLENSLSTFNIKDFHEEGRPDHLPSWFDPAIHTTCRYKSYRYPGDDPQAYSVTTQYWQIALVRLVSATIIMLLVFSIKAVIAYVIPDVPSHVQACARREHVVTQQALREADLNRVRKPLLADAPRLPPSCDVHVEIDKAETGLLHTASVPRASVNVSTRSKPASECTSAV